MTPQLDHVRKEVNLAGLGSRASIRGYCTMYSTERFSLPLRNATYVEVPRARYRTKLGNLQELLMANADGMVATLAPSSRAAQILGAQHGRSPQEFPYGNLWKGQTGERLDMNQFRMSVPFHHKERRYA